MQSPRPLRPLLTTQSFFALLPSIRPLLLRSSFLSKSFSTTQPATSKTTAVLNPEADLIPAPAEGSGPLLERMPNRALPNIDTASFTWLRTLPIFIFLITISSLGIFNYQKSSSSTVASVLYSLRISPAGRELLGDEIYFASKIPWIAGELNQLHGVINISFWVKGTKAMGKVKFVSVRKRQERYFQTLEWSLDMGEGKVVQLLDLGEGDPMGEK